MGIFFIWLGLVCCSVANWLIYDYVGVPGRYYYMMVPSVFAIVFLIAHRVYTRNWSYPKKKDKKDGKLHYHFQVFGVSAVFSSAMFMSTLLCVQAGEISWGAFIGSVTAVVVFSIATEKESYYV